MTSSEYELYNNLPECLKIYRGVAVGRNAKGISWTNDYEKAEWFSKRFDTSNKKGYILTAYIDKEHILAYFDRGEKEVVVDRKYLREV